MIQEAPQNRYIDSKALLDAGDFNALWERVNEEGYLFFRQLLPKEPILEVRRKILEVVGQYGWLQPNEDGIDNLADVGAVNTMDLEEMKYGIGVTNRAYEDVQRIEAFHALPHHPALLNLYRGLFKDEVLPHPRHIARVVTPHQKIPPTPQHQDFPLIQGTKNFWTCWFPLGDCPREMGSLTVLRKSQHDGYIPIERVEGAGEIATQLCPGEDTWIEGDFEAGDILTFPCFTVHKALKSQYPSVSASPLTCATSRSARRWSGAPSNPTPTTSAGRIFTRIGRATSSNTIGKTFPSKWARGTTLSSNPPGAFAKFFPSQQRYRQGVKFNQISQHRPGPTRLP